MTSKCKGCNKPVVEKVLRFDGDAWHPECFTCAGCKDPLDGKEITQVDGKAMCKDCYINKFTDKCYKCNKPISPGQPFMEIEGGKMHADCFKCADCGKSLAGEACVKQLLPKKVIRNDSMEDLRGRLKKGPTEVFFS